MTKDPQPTPHVRDRRRPMEAVVLGASVGAVEALSVILPGLPRGYALPLVVVVHSPPDEPSVITSLFQSPESAQAAAMPQAALAACPDAVVMTIEQVATFLQDLSDGSSA